MRTDDRINLLEIGSAGIFLMRRRQQGAVLIISLLLLLIMTLIGVTAMSTTTLEEKMSGNMRDRNVALQASETALEGGEVWLASLGTAPSAVSTCSAAPCPVWALNVLPDLAGQLQSWWLGNTQEYGAAGTKDIGEVATDPRYVVAEQAYVRDNLDAGQSAATGRNFYVVTSHGTGKTDDAQVIVQSTYVKRFN